MRVFRTIDQLLRGRHTGPQEGGIEVRVDTLLVAIAILGVAYGAFMGLYAALRGGSNAALQMVASMAKVPLLFLLTLVVTLPSLYVLSALARSRLSFTHTVRLLLAHFRYRHLRVTPHAILDPLHHAPLVLQAHRPLDPQLNL